MHVGGVTLDPNLFVRWLFTLLVVTIAVLLHLLKNTASKYFQLPARTPFFSMAQAQAQAHSLSPVCASCGLPGSKQCSRCKSVKYCSLKCQQAHWTAGHNSKCKEYEKGKFSPIASTRVEFKASNIARRTSSGIALVPAGGNHEAVKKPRDVLFPYEEFIELYNWDKPGFPPCGLLNCGNSCFANVVLQCLTITRPLVAYLLEKGHRRECRRNDWCFLCVLQDHVERSSKSSQAFSPANILSRLPSFGGNLGYGKQEDAHEFMRVAIDMMQSVCLDEFGGEKAVPHSAQETTLIQHIFGGRLQSQVICTKCDKVSSQLENMMDLTVEIHGEVGSLEECLVRFTAKEGLHGDNMYKCDGCNDYVKAWKRLTIQRAPNILTIALKRFQSGRFGKLNKQVTFPETLDLSPYMSDDGDGSDVYKLYAVVVHVDMLNASFFGHYICYTKDFQGKWYRIDDCEVTSVELKEVLSQGAYMLLYSRLSVRPSYLKNVIPPKEQELTLEANLSSRKDEMECLRLDLRAERGSNSHAADHSLVTDPSDSAVVKNTDKPKNDPFAGVSSEVDRPATNIKASETCFSPNSPVGFTSETLGRDAEFMDEVEPGGSTAVPMEVSDCEDDQHVEYSGNTDSINLELGRDSVKVNGTIELFASGATSTRALQLKRESHFRVLDGDNGNGYKRAEVANGY